MVDAIDSKSIISNGVRVQVPWLVPENLIPCVMQGFYYVFMNKILIFIILRYRYFSNI